MDVLTSVIDSLRPRISVQGRFELSAPWGFDAPSPATSFYVVIRGVCWLETHNGEALQLAPGDYALVAADQPHLLRDSRATRAVPFQELFEKGQVTQAGGGGTVTTLISGSIALESDPGNPLLAAMPPLLHIAAEGTGGFQSALRLFTAAAGSSRPGATAVARHLGELLLVEAISISMSSAATGWLRAVVDPHVGQALALMHGTPAAAWTVESLAKEVRMSRAAFAARFHELAGEPPLTYLTNLRMRAAAQRLRGGEGTVSDIAADAGYESEPAFNKAFKRTIGVTPGKYRRGTNPNRRRSDGASSRVRTGRSAGTPSKRPDWSFID